MRIELLIMRCGFVENQIGPR